MLGELGLRFVISAIIVVLAGTQLARSGDVIAARTKLGGLWVGSIFLALATSLPEIVTDITAVRMGAPDLAVGDLFGSSMANMLILALVSLAPSGAELFRRATLDHVLYASLAIMLTAIATIGLVLRSPVTLLGIGLTSWSLLAVYAIASRAAFRHSTVAQSATEVVEMSGGTHDLPKATMSLTRAALVFAGAALVILLAAPQFAKAAEGIAIETGVGTTFVGTWLVGLATSLPELVTSFAAVRLRAYDMAVGNLFGSNAINMVLFPMLDLFQQGAPILSIADPAHAVSALVAIVLMTIAIATLVHRSRHGRVVAEPGSLLIILGYILGIGLVFWRSISR
jgi:cation:H+ antiporter